MAHDALETPVNSMPSLETSEGFIPSEIPATALFALRQRTNNA